MALSRSYSLRWGIFFICLILGTWLGMFMQRFGATSSVFANFVNFNIDIRQIDLSIIRFGFHFAVRLNLGSVLGGAFGMWAAR